MILFVNVAFAIDLENPKSAEEITVKLIQSGTLIPTGHINYANITLYIPQNLESIDVAGADSWKYIYDDFGNKLLLLEWNNFDSNKNYRIESIVKNSATHTTEKSIGTDDRYTKETSTIIFNDDIRKAAYPYEKTLKKAAELTIFVNKIMTYDISLEKSIKPSDWVMQNRRGVCVEYANLLTALLRVSGIPTRYVVGYAYSENDKKMIGHAWVEVLANDGKWIPFDPTWLQGGTIDATHIKTASLLDSNQSDRLVYTSFNSRIDWRKNDDYFEILDYKKSEIDISVDGVDLPSNGYGYIKTTVGKTSFGYECTIYDLTAASCIDNNRNTMLEIYEPERKFWTCGEEDVYWFFKPKTNENNYICPVIIYDQLGNKGEKRVSVKGHKDIKKLSIDGPETVGINQKFNLTTNAENFIFYSPDFGIHDSNLWELSISNSGNYSFYFYSDNSLATKKISVNEIKEFEIGAIIPKNSTINKNFTIILTTQNLLNKSKNAILKIEDVIEKNISFAPGETKNYEFNLSSKTPGLNKITISILGDGITTYTSSIFIYEDKNIIQQIIDAIFGFFRSIVNTISSIFS